MDNNKYNNYFNLMYNNYEKKKVSSVSEEKYSKEERKAFDTYIEDIDTIYYDIYLKYITELESDIKSYEAEKTQAILSPENSRKVSVIENDIKTKNIALTRQLQKAEREIALAERKLKTNSRKMYDKLKREDKIVKELDDIRDKSNLEKYWSALEESLIFGDTLEKISDVIELEEASKAVLKAAGHANQAVKNLIAAEKNQKDNPTPQAAQTANIARNNARNAQANMVEVDIEEKADKEPLSLKEGLDTSKNCKYSDMLFNGASGEVLKYIINDEINNSNMGIVEIAKKVKEDSEAKIIIKKIKALLNKSYKKELSYEEYIELKVLKSKFKLLFNKAKKEEENKFKK